MKFRTTPQIMIGRLLREYLAPLYTMTCYQIVIHDCWSMPPRGHTLYILHTISSFCQEHLIILDDRLVLNHFMFAQSRDGMLRLREDIHHRVERTHFLFFVAGGPILVGRP